MPMYPESRNSVRQSIGSQLNLMVGRRTYTVTDGSTASARMEDLIIRDSSMGQGLELYVASGGGAGQARTVVSTTPFVAGTGSIVVPHVPFSTAVSTDSAIELWRGIEASAVNGFIDDAIRNSSRRMLQPKEDYAIQLGDPLRHWGSFERWPLGAAAAPSGWTLTATGGSVAREASLVFSGRYSALVTNGNGETAYLESDNIPDFAQFAGLVVSVKAEVYTTTGARVRLQLLDGVTTHNGELHDGLGGWNGTAGEPIKIDQVTLSDALTQLKVRCTTLTGTVVTAYWGKVWMETGIGVYEFDLPAAISPSVGDETGFAYISDVFVESPTSPGTFNIRVLNEFWDIDGDSSTRRIVFVKGKIDQYVTFGRQVKLVGQRYARLPASDTDNLEVDPEYVRLRTMYSVMDSLPWDEMDRSRRDRFDREAQAKLADITTAIAGDSVPVEAF